MTSSTRLDLVGDRVEAEPDPVLVRGLAGPVERAEPGAVEKRQPAEVERDGRRRSPEHVEQLALEAPERTRGRARRGARPRRPHRPRSRRTRTPGRRDRRLRARRGPSGDPWVPRRARASRLPEVVAPCRRRGPGREHGDCDGPAPSRSRRRAGGAPDPRSRQKQVFQSLVQNMRVCAEKRFMRTASGDVRRAPTDPSERRLRASTSMEAKPHDHRPPGLGRPPGRLQRRGRQGRPQRQHHHRRATTRLPSRAGGRQRGLGDDLGAR